jgi:hypothetical protein
MGVLWDPTIIYFRAEPKVTRPQKSQLYWTRGFDDDQYIVDSNPQTNQRINGHPTSGEYKRNMTQNNYKPKLTHKALNLNKKYGNL